MPTIEELVTKFEEKSTEELVAMHVRRGEYTTEAIAAMEIVFQKKGGLERLVTEVKRQQEIETEQNKKRNEMILLLGKGIPETEVLSSVTSELLSPEELEEIFYKSLSHTNEEKRDVYVNEKTIFLGFWGGLLGGTIAAVVLAVQIIYSQRLITFLIFASFIIPYLTIKAFTNQSYKNIAVLIMSVLAFFYACILCVLICKIYGIQLK